MNRIALRLTIGAIVAILIASDHPASAATLAYDSFTRPDNTDLNANRSGVDLLAPTNWVEGEGDLAVISGTLRRQPSFPEDAFSTAKTTLSSSDPLYAGVDYSLLGTTPDHFWIGVRHSGTIGRFSGSHYMIDAQRLGSGDIQFAVHKVVNGMQTLLLDHYALGSLPGRALLEVTGQSPTNILRFYLNGIQIGDTITDDSPIDTGDLIVGVRFNGILDNLKAATTFAEANDPNPPVVTPNRPPDTSQARPSAALLWPPNHTFVPIFILDVTDPDGDPVSLTITGIRQDEPVKGLGDGDTSPDGQGVGTPIAQVRAERAGSGNGRVYTITFEARDDKGGSTPGTLTVGVPLNQGQVSVLVNDGPVFDSTQP